MPMDDYSFDEVLGNRRRGPRGKERFDAMTARTKALTQDNDRVGSADRDKVKQSSQKKGAKPASKPDDGGGLGASLRDAFTDNGKVTAESVAEGVGAGYNKMWQGATAPLRAGAKFGEAAKPVVADVARGLVTGATGAQASEGQNTQQSQQGGDRAGDADLDAVRVKTDKRQPGAATPVQNNDPRLADYLRENSEARDPGSLDAKNTREIPGVEGTRYAGRYGKTDIFRGTSDEGHKAYSDLGNAATTRGGEAAAPPSGADAVSNQNGISFDPDQNDDGVPDQTSPELLAARKAAMERGDFDAVERSMMTSDEREAADAREQAAEGREDAYEQNPASAYATDQQRLVAQQQAVIDRLGQQADNQQETNETINKRAAGAYSILEGTLPKGEDAMMSLGEDAQAKLGRRREQFMRLTAQIAKKDPSLSENEIAAKAQQAIQGQGGRTADAGSEAGGNQSDYEAYSNIDSPNI